MPVALRTATLGDVGAVLELWQAAEAEPTHTDDAESLSRLIGHDPQALIVATDGIAVVGSIIAGWDGWRGSIYRIVVAPAHRRAGLARRLLAEAERRLDERGAKRSGAIVVDDDPRATGFWRASGWEEQSRRVRFVRG